MMLRRELPCVQWRRDESPAGHEPEKRKHGRLSATAYSDAAREKFAPQTPHNEFIGHNFMRHFESAHPCGIASQLARLRGIDSGLGSGFIVALLPASTPAPSSALLAAAAIFAADFTAVFFADFIAAAFHIVRPMGTDEHCPPRPVRVRRWGLTSRHAASGLGRKGARLGLAVTLACAIGAVGLPSSCVGAPLPSGEPAAGLD